MPETVLHSTTPSLGALQGRRASAGSAQASPDHEKPDESLLLQQQVNEWHVVMIASNMAAQCLMLDYQAVPKPET